MCLVQARQPSPLGHDWPQPPWAGIFLAHDQRRAYEGSSHLLSELIIALPSAHWPHIDSKSDNNIDNQGWITYLVTLWYSSIPSLKETDPDSMLVFLGNVSARHFVTVDSFLLMKLHSLLTHTICSRQLLAEPGGLQRNMTRLEMANNSLKQSIL